MCWYVYSATATNCTHYMLLMAFTSFTFTYPNSIAFNYAPLLLLKYICTVYIHSLPSYKKPQQTLDFFAALCHLMLINMNGICTQQFHSLRGYERNRRNEWIHTREPEHNSIHTWVWAGTIKLRCLHYRELIDDGAIRCARIVTAPNMSNVCSIFFASPWNHPMTRTLRCRQICFYFSLSLFYLKNNNNNN